MVSITWCPPFEPLYDHDIFDYSVSSSCTRLLWEFVRELLNCCTAMWRLSLVPHSFITTLALETDSNSSNYMLYDLSNAVLLIPLIAVNIYYTTFVIYSI